MRRDEPGRPQLGRCRQLRAAGPRRLVACTRRVELKGRGVRLIGASEKAEKLPSECDLNSPAAIVIGNEGTGMSDELKSCCDELVRIPQSGRIGSLNAAVAAGILVYEAGRQRKSLSTT